MINRFIILVAIYILTGCAAKSPADYIGNVSKLVDVDVTGFETKGEMAPDFSWYLSTGDLVSFREFTNGKVVMINFWSTWCPFCKMIFSTLRNLDLQYRDQDLIVIGISTLESINPIYRLEYIANFVSERDMSYQVVLDDGDSLWRAFGLEARSVPTTILIDRDGKIARAFTGTRTEEGFIEEIDRIINQK